MFLTDYRYHGPQLEREYALATKRLQLARQNLRRRAEQRPRPIAR